MKIREEKPMLILYFLVIYEGFSYLLALQRLNSLFSDAKIVKLTEFMVLMSR